MMYEFADLIEEYATDCTIVVPGEGKYSGGEYVAGEPTETTVRAAMIPMSQTKIYQSGGAYNSQDREMYIKTADDIINLEKQKKTYVKHGERLYKVDAADLYGEDYADFNHYTLKRVESFDQ